MTLILVEVLLLVELSEGPPVLQCVVVCCGVLRCVAVCCGVLQCVAVCCSEFNQRL